jgi:hypothetical protein
MKTSKKYAVLIYLILILGLSACGVFENVVSSSSNDATNHSLPADDNTDPIRLFDGPADPGSGGAGSGGN